MTPPRRIVIPRLDAIDQSVRQGEIVDADQVIRLTRIIRRLCEIITKAGGGGLLVKDRGDG